jgi:hypothetical protein
MLSVGTAEVGDASAIVAIDSVVAGLKIDLHAH